MARQPISKEMLIFSMVELLGLTKADAGKALNEPRQ